MDRFYSSNEQLSRSRTVFLAILAILLLCIGLASLIFSIIDLFHGKASAHNYDESQGGLKIENPLWPTSGKGFWVGLILIATGFTGILSSRERTRTSIIAFTALSSVSTILSFYMMITCIVPIQYDSNYFDQSKQRWQNTELILNSLLIASGALGAIIGTASTILGFIYSGCCVDTRDSYLLNPDSNKPVVNTSMIPTSYSYQQSTFGMPL